MKKLFVIAASITTAIIATASIGSTAFATDVSKPIAATDIYNQPRSEYRFDYKPRPNLIPHPSQKQQVQNSRVYPANDRLKFRLDLGHQPLNAKSKKVIGVWNKAYWL